jgi:ribonucleoside-diphosphate reductase beta chain
MGLLDIPAVRVYKPMHYPWAYDAWLMQRKIAWLPEEVPMAEDVQDYHNKLTDNERHLLTQIFRFFVQADCEVGGAYNTHFIPVFQPIEIKMMLGEFSATESVHIAAYSHLLETLGLPETEYSAFLQYAEMKAKYDYMQGFSTLGIDALLTTMAGFSAFTEGLQLFASFAMLLNFPRFNKMKSMGQIITWSVRDESLHVESMIKLFHTLLDEYPKYWTNDLRDAIYTVCHTIVSHEDAFIDLAFGVGGIKGMTAQDIKSYIRYVADRRLLQLHMKPKYKITKNPIPWLDDILNGMEFTNFFEQRSTNYAKASTTGDWSEAFAASDKLLIA